MKQSDIQRLHKIIDTGERLRHYLDSNKIDTKRIINEYEIQWAITTPLYNIGEQTYRLSKDLKEEYPDIPWSKISGLRHRLVHDYEGTNWSIISSAIFHDLPLFLKQVKAIIEGF